MKKNIPLFVAILLTSLALHGQGLQFSDIVFEEAGSTHTAGEFAALTLRILNTDAFAHQNCVITATSADPYVQFSDSTETFDYIGGGNEYTLYACISFQTHPETPNQHIANIILRIHSDQGEQTTSVSFLICASNIIVTQYQVLTGAAPIIHANERDTLVLTLLNTTGISLSDVDMDLLIDAPGIAVVSEPLHFDEISENGSYTFAAVIQTSGEFVEGTAIDAILRIRAGGELHSTRTVSIIPQNHCIYFEHDNLPESLSNVNAYATWTLDSIVTSTRPYALRSRAITHNDTCAVRYLFTTLNEGNLSFAIKTSTESNYDWLHCFIDGTEVERWSGENDWTPVSFHISEGRHEVIWMFSKDYSVSGGDDGVWIDDICIPEYANGIPCIITDTTAIELTLGGDLSQTATRELTFSNPTSAYILFSNDVTAGNGMPAGWVSFSPTNGSVNALSERTIRLEFTTAGYLPGDYQATLRIVTNLQDTLRIPLILHIASGTSVTEHRSTTLRIAPNPTTASVTITCNEILQRLTLYNSFGQQLRTETLHDHQSQLNLMDFSPGIYILSIQTASGTHTHRIIKR